MKNATPIAKAVSFAAMALTLTVMAQELRAEAEAAAGTVQPEPMVFSSTDALRLMAGMAGNFRKSREGDIYLYPRLIRSSEMQGMYGTYRVTQRGIVLYPTGMAGVTMGMSAMGGASGALRILPSGQAVFYPSMHAP